MAVNVTLYDHTVHRFVEGLNAEGDTYFINLYSALTPDASHTTKAAVNAAGTQLSDANGYTADAETLTCTITQTGTNSATVDFADASWTASGGDIGPASYAVLFNGTDTDDPPVLWIDWSTDGAKTANTGTDFKITWNASGVITFTY
jgi:hypothetical protein